MIKKTIDYKDLDGNPRSEAYWFQLTQADFTRKAMTAGGEAYLERLRGLSELTEETVAGRGQELMDTFETILFDAVGRREDDLFIKDEALTRRFRFSGAYDACFMELITTPDSGATFFKGVFPQNVGEAIDKALAEKAAAEQVDGEAPSNAPELQAAEPVLEETGKDTPAWLREEREPTNKELMEMSKDEMALAFRLKSEGKLNKK